MFFFSSAYLRETEHVLTTRPRGVIRRRSSDEMSSAVFILEAHYPSGRTWANICSSYGYASLV